MDRQQVFQYAREQYGTEPDYPWSDWNAVLRRAGNGKWYGLIMEIGKDKLGLPGDGEVDVINVKCDPILIGSLRARDGFHPAYHMNKENWISIRLDGSVPEDEVKGLIDMSYSLTSPKRKKRG